MVLKWGEVLQSHSDIAEPGARSLMEAWDCTQMNIPPLRNIINQKLTFSVRLWLGCPRRTPVKVRVWWLILNVTKSLFNFFFFNYLVSYEGLTGEPFLLSSYLMVRWREIGNRGGITCSKGPPICGWWTLLKWILLFCCSHELKKIHGICMLHNTHSCNYPC